MPSRRSFRVSHRCADDGVCGRSGAMRGQRGRGRAGQMKANQSMDRTPESELCVGDPLLRKTVCPRVIVKNQASLQKDLESSAKRRFTI
jgi:hypothetical protein